MKQHFYIHIGHHKTGTTSIQHHFHSHRDELLDRGIYYPHSPGKSCKHNQLAWKKSKWWPRLIAEAEQSGCPKVVFSEENLSLHTSAEKVEQIGRDMHGRDATIIYYIRRQDKFLASFYIQHLKTGGFVTSPEEFIKKYNVDHLEILSRWADVFGDHAVKVVPFEKETLQPSLLHTFFDIIGEELPPGVPAPRRQNVSPPPDVIAAMTMTSRLADLNILEKKDLVTFNTAIRALPPELVPPNSKFHLFTPEQKKQLIAGNMESYERIAERFLPHGNRTLFSNLSVEEDVEEFSFTKEGLLLMLITSHVESYRRHERLRRKFLSYRVKDALRTAGTGVRNLCLMGRRLTLQPLLRLLV